MEKASTRNLLDASKQVLAWALAVKEMRQVPICSCWFIHP